MDERNYWQRKVGRPVSRRAALRGAGLGIAGLTGAALIGCGGNDDDEVAAPTAAPTTAATAAGTAAATATQAPAAAPAGPKRGGVAVSQSANVYETVDPQQTVASPVLQILGRAQSKILRFANPDSGELTSDLAESWEQPDGQTLVLDIRRGVKWHSAGPGAAHAASTAGRDLTVEDIVYNIERQKAGLLADGTDGSFGRKAYWSKVDSIDQSGQTLTLHLSKPDATFLEGIANEFNLIVQRELMEAVEPAAQEIFAEKVIGTGPYILTEWVPGEAISAVRNPDYFLKDRPLLDGQHWTQSFEDPTANRIAFEQKQQDAMSDPDPGTLTAINQANADSTYLTFSGVANTVAAYVNPNEPPWNDLRLVKAINLALDRRQLIQQLHNGLGKVSGPVSWMQEAWAISQEELETTPGYRVDKAQDLKEANEFWSAAGGSSLGTIEWVVAETWASRAAWGSTPEIIANMFNDAFSTDQFRGATKSYGEIIPSWFAKKFDPFFAWIPNIEIPDARADMVAAFSSASPANIFGVNEPENIDARLDAALEELDKEKAFEILKGVQDFVLENGQFGRFIAYNYISPAVRWNYQHPRLKTAEEDWNFLSSSLNALEDWLDPDDPSFEGRAVPRLKTL